VGNNADDGALSEELGGAGMPVERWTEDSHATGGPEEIAAIARELREFERVLGDGGPNAVLVASDSSASLAAVLVATKLETPVASIGVPAGDPAGANARLIGQLADARLAPEAAAIVNWLRDTYTDRA
jgi:UDP-N-acetylglucosamine 2-epimerase